MRSISLIKIVAVAFFISSFALPVSAQTVSEYITGRVERVISEEQTVVEGTEAEALIQELDIKILEGTAKGKVITVQNDYIKLKAGDKIFLYHAQENGQDTYSVKERDRRSSIFFLLGLFAVAILVFGKMQGFRSLLSLMGGFLVIVYILLPGLLNGYPPILISTIVATLILFFAIFFTHGFNRESSVAFLGTITAVLLTGILAYLSVKIMSLTGFNTEEAVMLNLQSTTNLDYGGLLLGGILIGVLGVLDDIATTQAAVVSELYNTSPDISKNEVYTRAIRVGKEHVSALVNTLALAYTGASLPLLMTFNNSEFPISLIVSSELFATEIVRTIVGSIGLVLTVPITTLLAVFMLKGYKGKHHGHSHSHGRAV